MDNIASIFGVNVFNDAAMRAHMSDETYTKFKSTVESGKPLQADIAGEVAAAMMDWAVSKGATHFTHWFQPMTGVTAEKHESFIVPSEEGGATLEFSDKMLIRGEPDASSFPSGGLRATFEARGYTAWDPSSYAFIKDDTLCIPTAFCSYTGEALDKKTPLLRSMDAINRESLRILKLLGHTEVSRVSVMVGAEQEYFLIDKELYQKRRDLICCGRTLYGAKPPKGQEMEDHYSGIIRPRVAAYMKELDEELWRLGVAAKIRHNESAPSQHEMAPVYDTINIATDHNQLVMEMMKKVADRHGLVCLLHEKPFSGVNGSGKHNNWSLSTDTGINLLKPSREPGENKRFLLFLCAVIKAVNDYQELLRMSAATAGNDCRLGGSEAPPAVMSIFLGDELSGVLEAVGRGEDVAMRGKSDMGVGVGVIPNLRKDTTDRNRTSPFAFTGNRFEFRMVGSALSIAGPNFVLNTIVADTLALFADELEQAADFETALKSLLSRTINENKRIVYNGNNYSGEWAKEASERGLACLPSAVEALTSFLEEKSLTVFERQRVLSRAEIASRYEILLDIYCKACRIEAATMLDIEARDITPAIVACINDWSIGYESQVQIGLRAPKQYALLHAVSERLEKLCGRAEKLRAAAAEAALIGDTAKAAFFYRYTVLPAMAELRAVADELEVMVGRKYWPMPGYSELLYSV